MNSKLFHISTDAPIESNPGPKFAIVAGLLTVIFLFLTLINLFFNFVEKTILTSRKNISYIIDV